MNCSFSVITPLPPIPHEIWEHIFSISDESLNPLSLVCRSFLELSEKRWVKKLNEHTFDRIILTPQELNTTSCKVLFWGQRHFFVFANFYLEQLINYDGKDRFSFKKKEIAFLENRFKISKLPPLLINLFMQIFSEHPSHLITKSLNECSYRRHTAITWFKKAFAANCLAASLFACTFFTKSTQTALMKMAIEAADQNYYRPLDRYFMTKSFDEALFQKLQAYPSLWLWKALHTTQEEAKEQFFQIALQLYGEHVTPECLIWFALLKCNQQEFTVANNLFDQALRYLRTEASPSVCIISGLIKAKCGEFEKAIELYKQTSLSLISICPKKTNDSKVHQNVFLNACKLFKKCLIWQQVATVLQDIQFLEINLPLSQNGCKLK